MASHKVHRMTRSHAGFGEHIMYMGQGATRDSTQGLRLVSTWEKAATSIAD